MMTTKVKSRYIVLYFTWKKQILHEHVFIQAGRGMLDEHIVLEAFPERIRMNSPYWQSHNNHFLRFGLTP